MLRPEIDSDAVKKLINRLKEIDPDLAKQLTKDLKQELVPVAARIQDFLPQSAPLSGMDNDGRLGFERLRVTASATPAAGWGRPFAKFNLNGRNEANASMIEFAGKRSQGKTASGRAMIAGLDQYPGAGQASTGRFFFEGYRRNKGGIYQALQKILNRYTDIVNRELN